jgi:hypothetical protein
MLKVGFSGERGYENKSKIKGFIYLLKQKGDIEIVGCGTEWKRDLREIMYPLNNLGNIVKQFSLMMKLPYKEFPLIHQPHNMYCVLKPYYYNKPFKVWNYKQRDKQMVKYCDKLVLFKKRDTKNHKDLNFIIKELERLNKPYITITD